MVSRILVAGASRGIGKALADALADDGHAVTAIARDQKQLEAIRYNSTKRGVGIETASIDLTDRQAIATFFESRVEPFDAMIVTAGIARHRHLPEILDQDLDDTLQMNIAVPILCTRAFTRLAMKYDAAGSIVLFSSQLAHVGAADRSVYCASKAAVDGFARGAVADLSQYKIRINTVCPTFTETEMTRAALSDPAFRQSVEAKIPLGRLGQPDDCIGVCKLLISDEASMITGTSIRVDGGWTAL
jgi:NAD(P)-dependent dehydrogenase (short-subunit alcohol dehydrogenase family)